MSTDNFDLSIISDFVTQLEHCHTVFDVSRTLIRNFVGYFMPENAAFFLAPNASYPFYECIDRYSVNQNVPQKIPGNGGLLSVIRKFEGANLVSSIPIYNLIEAEQKVVLSFQYLISVKNQSHFAGILLFSMRNQKEISLNASEIEFLKIMIEMASKTFQSLVKPVDLHIDKISKLYTKDYLWAMMDQNRYLIQEVMQNKLVSYDFTKKAMPRNIFITSPSGKNALNIGYSIILIKIQNLNEINHKYDFEKGNQVLQQFGLELKLVLRRSDVPCRYEGSQFVVFLPFTTKDEAFQLKNSLEKILEDVKAKQQLPKEFPLTLKLGFAHFPSDGDENYLLLQAAEKDL